MSARLADVVVEDAQVPLLLPLEYVHDEGHAVLAPARRVLGRPLRADGLGIGGVAGLHALDALLALELVYLLQDLALGVEAAVGDDEELDGGVVGNGGHAAVELVALVLLDLGRVGDDEPLEVGLDVIQLARLVLRPDLVDFRHTAGLWTAPRRASLRRPRLPALDPLSTVQPCPTPRH